MPGRFGARPKTCPLSSVVKLCGWSAIEECQPRVSSVLPFSFVPFQKAPMDLFELTRALVDIESVTNNEAAAGEFLFRCLSPLAAKYGGHVERMPVGTQRLNGSANWGKPVVTRSTHMDTVPPFFPLSEDDEFFL